MHLSSEILSASPVSFIAFSIVAFAVSCIFVFGFPFAVALLSPVFAIFFLFHIAYRIVLKARGGHLVFWQDDDDDGEFFDGEIWGDDDEDRQV